MYTDEDGKTRFAPKPDRQDACRKFTYSTLFLSDCQACRRKLYAASRDTDQERFVQGALEIIYQTLSDAGISFDEGPDKDGGAGPMSRVSAARWEYPQ